MDLRHAHCSVSCFRCCSGTRDAEGHFGPGERGAQTTTRGVHQVREAPQTPIPDRIFWVLLRRLWSEWARALVVVKPATVIGWHRKGFSALWRHKSKPGRPRIPRKHINFIKRMSADHPDWGEDKIVEELAAKFCVSAFKQHRQAVHGHTFQTATWRPDVAHFREEPRRRAMVLRLPHTVHSIVQYCLCFHRHGDRVADASSIGESPRPRLCLGSNTSCARRHHGESPRFLVHDNDEHFRPVQAETIRSTAMARGAATVATSTGGCMK